MQNREVIIMRTIEEIVNEMKTWWSNDDCDKEIQDNLDEILKIHKAEQTRWIPVSARLPEEYICDDGFVEPSDYVLVRGDHGNYGVSRYWGNRKSKAEDPNRFNDWMDLDWIFQRPIAWMPLPEPYKAESEAENGNG